jgi:peptide/nickel transport system permease protein
MCLVVVVLSMLVFAWLRSLPGGPVSAMLGERQTSARRAALEAALGLDQPLPVQYLKFLERAIHGEFGVSTKVLPGEDALQVFLDRLPATIELSFLALLLAIVLGIPLGYVAARRRGSPVDTGAVIFSLVGVAVPVFFLAFLLKYFFAVEWNLLPVSGRQSTGIEATRVTGMFVLDGILTREWDAAWDALKHLILPAVALASIPFAVIFRITRASVLDVLDEDYVRTAEAKGLTARVIRGRHVLRNAMLPVHHHRPPDRRAPRGSRADRVGLLLPRGRRRSRDRVPGEGLPRAPGPDPRRRGHLRAGQPARRHRLRAHRPTDQDEVR